MNQQSGQGLLEYLLVVVVVVLAVVGFITVYGTGVNTVQTTMNDSITQMTQTAN